MDRQTSGELLKALRRVDVVEWEGHQVKIRHLTIQQRLALSEEFTGSLEAEKGAEFLIRLITTCIGELADSGDDLRTNCSWDAIEELGQHCIRVNKLGDQGHEELVGNSDGSQND